MKKRKQFAHFAQIKGGSNDGIESVRPYDRKMTTGLLHNLHPSPFLIIPPVLLLSIY
jgi:hypothetical protein